MLMDGANIRNLAYHTAGDTLEDRLNFTFMRRVGFIAGAGRLPAINPEPGIIRHERLEGGFGQPIPGLLKTFCHCRLFPRVYTVCAGSFRAALLFKRC